MAKKRGSKDSVSEEPKEKTLPEDSKPQKTTVINSMDLDEINRKLAEVLDLESNILKEEKIVEKKEERLAKEEKKIEAEEKKAEVSSKIVKKIESAEKREEEDLERLERLEREIKEEVGVHPLAKINYKDVIKGFVGAFIGLSVHYTFTYGVEIAEKISDTRATLLYIVSFLVGLLFIYATGFRKIKDPKILAFMPVRLIVLYITSLVAAIIVLLVFYADFGHSFAESYKMVAGVLLAAIIGACTADLIGKE